MKIGGSLLFSSVVANQPSAQPRQLKGALTTKAGQIEVFAYQYSEDQIHEALKDAGFSIVRFDKFSPDYYQIDHSYAEEGIEANTFVLLARKEV